MNDQLMDIFNEVEDFHWWFAGRRKLLAELLGSRKKKRKILDVGCGTGGNMKFLEGWGEVWGVDVSRKAVDICRKKGLGRVRTTTATKLPYRAKSFDAVMFLDVLEHIKDDAKALSEARRVLKPGGRVIVTVPASPQIWSKHDQMQGHYRRYDRGALITAADRGGLRPERVRYFNVFLWPVIAGVRILSRYKRFARLGEYDSKINFDIARVDWINKLLMSIFSTELDWGRKFNYPIGVSLAGVFKSK